MRYISTRGAAPALGFTDVLLAGLARDGGLYVPETWPKLTADEIRALRGLRYEEIAFRIMRPFVGGEIADADLQSMIADAYATFRHQAVVPLKQLDDNLWFMELFHGPTLAFKDVALQLVGRLYDHVLDQARRSASPSSAPPPAIPARPRSKPAATAPASTSSCCIPRAACPRCSAGR